MAKATLKMRLIEWALNLLSRQVPVPHEATSAQHMLLQLERLRAYAVSVGRDDMAHYLTLDLAQLEENFGSDLAFIHETGETQPEGWVPLGAWPDRYVEMVPKY